MTGNMLKSFALLILVQICNGYLRERTKLEQVFSWKQISYNYDGVYYHNDTDSERVVDGIYFEQELKDSEKFFMQYNNIPVGVEVFKERVFVTVPRRQYGIPSTLNYVHFAGESNSSPLLMPYPDVRRSRQLVSVYRPRVDACNRLWMVDTGLLEVPGNRRQVQTPAIIVFDLKTDTEVLRYELKPSDLVNERSPAGLTSITVEVDPGSCDDAYAYINDLATNSLIVFSMKDRDSWRWSQDSFIHDPSAMNFTVAGSVINWKDGLFSIALAPGGRGHARIGAYYHPLVSTHEYFVPIGVLKNRHNMSITRGFEDVGSRGALSQSGSHDYHSGTGVMFFANVAQDAISCWHVGTTLKADNVPVVLQDHGKLVYIADLKVRDDYVWVLANQIPRFIYSKLDPMENNFYVHRANVHELIKSTACSVQ